MTPDARKKLRDPLDTDDECIFGEPDCGPVTMYDNSGEPWCDRCRRRVRHEMIAEGLNDPERPLQ